MSACQFDFHLRSTSDRLFGAIAADFARFGGTVSAPEGAGDGPRFGEFSLPTPIGTFTGSFLVRDRGTDRSPQCAVRVTVDDKPLFVPCAAIEEHIERRLRKAAGGA